MRNERNGRRRSPLGPGPRRRGDGNRFRFERGRGCFALRLFNLRGSCESRELPPTDKSGQQTAEEDHQEPFHKSPSPRGQLTLEEPRS